MEMEQKKTADTEPSSLEEISRFMRMLKNNKAPGTDGIAGKLWKYGGDEVFGRLHALMRKIWCTEQLPKEWNKSTISPIYKNGDKLNSKSHKEISVLNKAYEVPTVLKKRLER